MAKNIDQGRANLLGMGRRYKIVGDAFLITAKLLWLKSTLWPLMERPQWAGKINGAAIHQGVAKERCFDKRMGGLCRSQGKKAASDWPIGRSMGKARSDLLRRN